MDIIVAKQGEVDLLSRETVYDGPPDGHKWSSQATFITRQNRETSAALARVGRRFDNLYIRKNGGERWHLFSSPGKDGQPPVLFYFWYDAHGFKSFVYVGWLKLKTQDFVDMDPTARDQLLTNRQEIDVEAIWRKDRSISNIGFALESLPRSSVDAAIRKIAKKLKTNVDGLEINAANINKVSSLISSMKRINTAEALALANVIEEVHKRSVIVKLLNALQEGALYSIPSILKRLRANNIAWPELEIIERSYNAEERRKSEIRESSDWISGIHDRVLRDAESELDHNLPEGNYWTIGKVIMDLTSAGLPREATVRLLDRHKHDIIDTQQWLLSQEMAGVQAGLRNMRRMIEVGLDWPELHKAIEDNKDSILRTTLWELANSNEEMYANDGLPMLYGDLVRIGVRWPEMAIIAKSIGGKA